MRSIFLIFMSCGLLLFVIGWYILKSKKIELLSQYDYRRKYNRDALAKFSGRNLFIMGLLVVIQNLIFWGLSFIWKEIIFVSIAGFAISIGYFSFKVAFRVSKYEI
ncbi:MAG: hypothetical protein A2Y21_10710 [Clostridiales bacterium GWC2_40_7]|nr:MAG: hypothetical protein A2Y21_10710 [Clostridiales bacterium GWC2_40_7]